ncbi:MAG: LON peptidase substrate-binding domain-containing protein [Vicinamibacteria bacterium]|jgi:Lon protease-like protein|nr:LON peptidase substrate-binding domain-containing protein [Vicinamibacteria bacterium]
MALPLRIPLFPLPDVALFPGLPLPLHVFEPRYRRMVADALEGDRTIGLVILRPGFEADYEGRPAVFPIGCAGRIEEIERRPDGRYDMRLRGLSRFRILEENPGHPYRVATVEPLAEGEGAGNDLADARKGLLSALGRAPDGPAVLVVQGEVDDATFVNALAQALPMGAVERQSLVDAGDVHERGRRLLDLLEFQALEQRAPVTGRRHVH